MKRSFSYSMQKRPAAAPTSKQLCRLKFLCAHRPNFYAISYKAKESPHRLLVCMGILFYF